VLERTFGNTQTLNEGSRTRWPHARRAQADWSEATRAYVPRLRLLRSAQPRRTREDRVKVRDDGLAKGGDRTPTGTKSKTPSKRWPRAARLRARNLTPKWTTANASSTRSRMGVASAKWR